MCLDMFGREIREKRRKDLSKKLPKSSSSFFFFWQNEGSGSIYSRNLTLQLPATLE